MNNVMSNSKRINISLSSRTMLVIFFAMLWARSIIMEYMRAVFMRLPILNYDNGNLAINVIYIVVFLFALPEIIKNLHRKTVLIAIAFAFVYIIQFFLFPQNREYLLENALTVFLNIFLFFWIGSIVDLKKVDKLLYYISFVTIICFTVYVVFIGDPMDVSASKYEGNMYAAYNLLPHLCLVGYYALTKTNIFNGLIFLVGAIILFILGSRGPVLCLAVFVLLTAILLTKTKTKIILFICFVLIALILSVGNNLYNFLTLLERLAERLGLSVRIADKLLSGDILVSSGRDKIIEDIIPLIEKNWVVGSGIFSDRVLLSGTYTHNIFFELAVNFGYIGAVICCIALLVVIVKKYMKSDKDEKMFLLILVVSSIIKLFLSGSYITDAFFFLMLGFCFNKNMEKTASSDKNGQVVKNN